MAMHEYSNMLHSSYVLINMTIVCEANIKFLFLRCEKIKYKNVSFNEFSFKFKNVLNILNK